MDKAQKSAPKEQEVRFADLKIPQKLLDALHKNKFTHPTPIQEQVIPHGIAGKDVVGIAQTGTGKTLGFSIPMIVQIARRKGQGLVLLPTRELALQVEKVLHSLGTHIGLKTAVVIGGTPINRQVRALKQKPHIIVATPGRLADHMQQKNVNLDSVCVVVLDEADRMLDVGFLPQIKKILQHTPKDRQSLLFSATMPSAISEIAKKYMRHPERVEVARAGTAAKNIEQHLFVVDKPKKMQLLDKLLSENDHTALVFSRTKHGAKKIARQIRDMGHSATELHSNRSQNQRKHSLNGFAKGDYRVMVATDIAARGIDVSHIKLVVNYDLPDNTEDYVHRIGRTGRAGRSGRAVSFATRDQHRDVKQIERLIKKKLQRLELPTLPERRQIPKGEHVHGGQHTHRRREKAHSGNGQGRRRGGRQRNRRR